jgi:hypothetical protein
VTTIEVSKQDIIRALETAGHLRGHLWHDANDGQKVGGDYPMCAVGAVVRAHLSPEQPVDRLDDAASACVSTYIEDTSPEKLMERGDWMGALMCAFEQRLLKPGGKRQKGLAKATARTRTATIAFVREHFPARIRINIGDAKPRRGVRVVEP